MNTLSTIVNLSSVSCLKELTPAQIVALNDLNIHRLSDLLNYRPIVNARAVTNLLNSDLVFDIKKSGLLDNSFAEKSIHEIPALPIKALSGIGENDSKIFKDHFNVTKISELAEFKPYLDAEREVFRFSNEFSEPASAPEELMPKMLGHIQSSVNFSSFIKEKTIRFKGLELVYDDQKNYVDPRMAALFPVHGILPLFGILKKPNPFLGIKAPVPEMHVGYITKMSQKWVNMGTHLGEIIHSMPLAPGESRNIAVIDWKRKQATDRKEDTDATENLTNELFHKRALDEVTRSTANEHQFGGTDIAAGTLATAGAGVVGAAVAGGIAGTIPGAVIGGLLGGGTGGVTIPVVGAIPGGAIGALAGAVIGFGLGASISGGASLLGAANAQLGTVHADSSGDRAIVGELSQNISETTVQKASSVRSLWSSIVVTDEQAENEKLSTRNVTNYNHSHALTIQYYEVLQHYKSEISLTGAEPILYLPFRPLEFSIDFISDYWDILSKGIRDIRLRREFDAVINGLEQEAELGSPKIEYISIHIQRMMDMGGFGGIFSNAVKVNLAGIPGNKNALNNTAFFNFKETVDADLLEGVQVLQLSPGEPAKVIVRTGLVNDQNTRNIVTRESDLINAGSNGVLNFNFTLDSNDGLSDDLLQRRADEIERYFNSRRYFFTRLLLLSIEKEQLIDLVESLMLRASVQVKIPGLIPLPGLTTRPFNTNTRTLPETLFESTQPLLMKELDDMVSDESNIRLSKEEKKTAMISIIDDIRRSIDTAAPSDPKDINHKKNTLSAVKSSLEKKLSKIPGVNTKLKVELSDKIKDIINAGFLEIASTGFTESVHLSEFIDTTPLAIAGNTILFKMKKVVDPAILANKLVTGNNHVKSLKEYPESISAFIRTAIEDQKERKKHSRNADVYLPTSGVFAEAVLGRSNASEKIDITRFFNWQDSMIPHLAPQINALTAGGRQVDPITTTPTVPGNVLNIVNPSPFPDPTGMSSVLSAIQNGNIFRDMSKTEQLRTVMANLSNLAQSMANQAGSLAGTAQTEALKAAADIGKAVAQLASQSASQPQNIPTTTTQQGGAVNLLDQLKASPNPIPDLDEETKSVIGVPARVNPPTRRTKKDLLLTFSIEDVNEFPMSIRNLPGVSGNIRLIGSKVGDRVFELVGSQEAFGLSLSKVELDESPIRLSVSLLDDEDNLVFSGVSKIDNPLSSDVFHFRAIMESVTEEVEDIRNNTIEKEVKESFSGKISPNLTLSLTPSIKVSAKESIGILEVTEEVGGNGTVGGGVSGEVGGESGETETNSESNTNTRKFTIKIPTGKLSIKPL